MTRIWGVTLRDLGTDPLVRHGAIPAVPSTESGGSTNLEM